MAAQRPQKERFCQAVFSTLQCTEAVLPSKERTVQNCTLTGINEEAEACWKYHSQLFDVLNASFSWAGCKKPKMTVRGKKAVVWANKLGEFYESLNNMADLWFAIQNTRSRKP